MNALIAIFISRLNLKFKNQELQIFSLKLNLNICVLFNHLKLVGCRSEIQLQVGENLN